MAGAPPYFVDSLRRFDGTFEIDDVTSLHPDLTRETIRVYLSMATRDGLLERVAMGTYQLPEPPSIEGVSAYPPLEKLRANLMPNAWRRLVVWSDEDVAGFTHDAIMSAFLVIEAPRKVIGTIQSTLERNGTLTIQLKNRRRLTATLRESHPLGRESGEGPVILVPNEELAGTQASEHGYRVPEPERLFLDFLGDDPYALDYLADATPHYRMDPFKLLRLASSRKRTGEIASMLTTLIAMHPDHPMRDALTERWPWIERLR